MFLFLAMSQAGCRRSFPRHLLHRITTLANLVFAALIAQAIYIQPVSAESSGRPNIVFIMADDLGWRDVGYMGAEFFETPNIDRFAAQGMTFTAAYSGGPNCAPTRACLMSGMYTPRHHIYTPGGKSKGKLGYMRLLVPARDRKDKTLEKKAAALFRTTNSLDPEFVMFWKQYGLEVPPVKQRKPRPRKKKKPNKK